MGDAGGTAHGRRLSARAGGLLPPAPPRLSSFLGLAAASAAGRPSAAAASSRASRRAEGGGAGRAIPMYGCCAAGKVVGPPRGMRGGASN